MVVRVERTVNEPSFQPTLPSAFDQLYRAQWWPMLRLATGLVDSAGAAEDVVQDAFAALDRRWSAIREPDAAIGYLRTSVVKGARSVLRRRQPASPYLEVVWGCPPIPYVIASGAEPAAEGGDATWVLAAEHQVVVAALATLPDRQREVLTLRYLADLSDAEIAGATGLSPGGVRSAASRGLAALRVSLKEEQS